MMISFLVVLVISYKPQRLRPYCSLYSLIDLFVSSAYGSTTTIHRPAHRRDAQEVRSTKIRVRVNRLVFSFEGAYAVTRATATKEPLMCIFNEERVILAYLALAFIILISSPSPVKQRCELATFEVL